MLSRKIFTSVLLFSVYRSIFLFIGTKEKKKPKTKVQTTGLIGIINDQRCSQTCIYISSYFTVLFFLPEVTPCAIQELVSWFVP